MDYSKVYKVVEQSVVNVVILDESKQLVSTASGVIIDDGQKVLTCSHCCNPNLTTGVFDKVNNIVHVGTIVFNDVKNDIAVIKFPERIGNPLKIVGSDLLEIGNEVFTVGYPYAIGSEKTLTVGNIAAFENGLIKINTSVNNGNSGGPLFNLKGEIVGIVNAKLGSLSCFLRTVEQQRPQAYMVIDGLNPVQVIQQMIREMQRNLNLGIGYAIPSSRIASFCDIVNDLLIC